MEIIEFLTACLDEDTARATAAAEEDGPDWQYDGHAVITRREGDLVAVGSQDFMELERGEHIAAHDPARVLREIESKRQLVERYERAMKNRRAHPNDLASAGAFLALHGAVKLLAAPYSERPGFREEWRP